MLAHLCSGSSRTTRALSERGQLRGSADVPVRQDSELSGVWFVAERSMPETITDARQHVVGSWQLEARADRARSDGHRRQGRVMRDQTKLPVATGTKHVVADLERRPHTETRKPLIARHEAVGF